MSRLHCITPWQGRKPSVLSEERLSPREEKPCGFVPPFFCKKMAAGFFNATLYSELLFEAKNSEFRCEIKF